ncbi:acetoacetyl-CoA synthetase [Thalassovita litoralis]|jgi:acetoacetyl-CoA synthetase|uniref:Acetoacetyl-CoA synthetase n=1 Tax=Thalassovita litoralis TaxID=1010611 RepID=A0A521B0I5_9RHOB|nr:acetoacetate--CoA ligase [Thalassovita litoralis]SMO40617.1 acetoacetyl-CoA synthetase [Thalassovita litoralis]
MSEDRKILWTPTKERAEASLMAEYIRWLKTHRGLEFADYNALWEWSISDLDGFWTSIVEFFDLKFSKPWDVVLKERKQPGAEWFVGAEMNFADQVFRWADAKPDAQALIVQSQTVGRKEYSWAELRQSVANVADHLRGMGVGKGDRVVAILPNTELSIIAFLATISLGAIWSLCAPDMGHVAILDRFKQIEPKVLIAQDGYNHMGKMIDRRDIIAGIAAGLPTLEQQVILPIVGDLPDGAVHWDDMVQGDAELQIEQVDFSHPIWVVYSSGTTGNPKPIVHGHGGALLEGAKASLHMDLTDQTRFSWLTSSGWIMWNVQATCLAKGATVAMFDGAANYPDMMEVWRFVAAEKLDYFGAGAAYFSGCQKAGIKPAAELDLSALVSIGATGSPMTAEGYDWVYGEISTDAWLAPISGGTDIAGAFVCGNPMLPVRAGEMQARALGNAVRSFDEMGNELIGEVGELVCTEPLPSMPLYFWGDEGNLRLIDSYYDTYPGVWRHGDWIEITAEGGSVIYGRSDATINRRGLRLGSSEIYRAVEALDEVQDSLVVDLEFLGRDSFMPLFVVMTQGHELDDAMLDKIRASIRASVSARFLPDEIVAIPEVPRTLSGKKLEVPVKKLLLGGDPAKVVNRDSMANPDSFDMFIRYAADHDRLGHQVHG